MFWKFYLDSSGIDTLLSKEDVTLKEVLDEEDILQECKTQNTKLTDFFVKDVVITELLHMIVEEPPQDAPENIRFKYANVACEVLTSDIVPVLEKVASNKDLLDILWSILDRPAPLNSLLASFFSKAITMLLVRKGRETFNYIKSMDGVNRLLVHIEISAIMELFIKMVTVTDSQDLRSEISKWLNSEDLIGKLIRLMRPSSSPEKHYYAAQLLSELIRTGRDSITQYIEGEEDPLLKTLEKQETVAALLEAILAEDVSGGHCESSVVCGISSLLSMIETKRPTIEGMDELVAPVEPERVVHGIQSTLQALAVRLEDFHNILLAPPRQQPMQTTVGVLDPPLGQVRLAISALIASAVAANTKVINETLVRTGTLSLLLDLFSRYEWNNFLHTHVHQCVNAILNSEQNNRTQEEDGKDSFLLKHLFRECTIVQRVLEAWEFNEKAEGQQSGHRKGYMGHLTKIANDIVAAQDRGPNKDVLKTLFNELPEEARRKWNDLVKGPLEEVNAKNACLAVSLVSHRCDSTSDSDDSGGPINITQYEGTLQQAFENYQVQPMTNEFIDSFGYDEDSTHENESVKNPFDEVGNIDFSIKANEESPSEKLFESVCKQRIRPFEDSSSDEEEVWEEKQLEFASPASLGRAREKKGGSAGEDSDESESPPASEEDEEVEGKGKPAPALKASSLFQTSSPTREQEEKMDVDSEWTAAFGDDGMETVDTTANDWMQIVAKAAVLPATVNPDPAAPVVEDFVDFTNLADVSEKTSRPPNDAPVAMDADNSLKPFSPYEVQMDDNESRRDPKRHGSPKNEKAGSRSKLTLDIEKSGASRITSPPLSPNIPGASRRKLEAHFPKVSMARRVTSITVKSVRSPDKADVKFDDGLSKVDVMDVPSPADVPNKPPAVLGVRDGSPTPPERNSSSADREASTTKSGDSALGNVLALPSDVSLVSCGTDTGDPRLPEDVRSPMAHEVSDFTLMNGPVADNKDLGLTTNRSSPP